ncbi:MAG: hypothetical protein GYA24_08895 [Candidatus Lokiarchaeota archaeon]|nr:hypothetical protein [Candidatus Lokiarchaeota archaeon]
MSDEEKQPSKDDVEQAKEALIKLFTSQKEEMDKWLAETKESRASSMKKSKETISKHVGEKAFISSKQKEAMARTPASIADGDLGTIVDKLNKEIGLKSFLSASQKDKVEQLKRISISPEAFKGIQEQIDSTIAMKAMSVDHARASTKVLAASKEERLQRMKTASEKLEKSDVIQSRAILAEKRKSEGMMPGDKEDRAKRMKEASDALEKSDALTSRALRADMQKAKDAQLGDKDGRAQRMKDASDAIARSDAITSRALRADKQKQQDAALGNKDDRAQRMKEATDKLDADPAMQEKLKKK